jgi:serine/alanine adding enzyme
MSVRIVNTLPEGDWKAFVAQHPQGNIFHTPEMFQVFSHTKGYRPELWAITKDENILSLFLPVQITLFDGPLRVLTSRSVVYGGVLSAPGMEGQEALRTLLQFYKREVKGFPLFTEIRNVTDHADIQPLLNENGFTYEEHLNYLIDLNLPEEIIWGNFDKALRKHTRSSEKKDTIVEEVKDQGGVTIANEILRQTFTRVHVPLASPTLFEAAYDILTPKGMFKIFLARTDGHYIGTQFLLLFKDVLFAWYGGSNRTFSSFYSEELLLWKVLQWGKTHKFHQFDFGGAGKPSEDYGPRMFKAKFGGRLVNYGRNIYVHAPIRLKLSKIGYATMRRFIRT